MSFKTTVSDAVEAKRALFWKNFAVRRKKFTQSERHSMYINLAGHVGAGIDAALRKLPSMLLVMFPADLKRFKLTEEQLRIASQLP
jgi:hypothetical protein